MEIWKEVKGYEGIYEVSNLGNVKSLNYNGTKKEKELKICYDSDGYCIVSLFKNKVSKTRKVHQLVAESFLNHTPNGMKLVVNHINFIRNDNRLENLEIISQRINTNLKHLKSSSKYTGVSWYKSMNKWVSQIKINGKQKNLGYFKTELEAHNAYQKALITINK